MADDLAERLADIAAFDELPRELREVLRELPYSLSAAEALAYWRARGDQAIPLIVRSLRAYCERLGSQRTVLQ